MTASVSARPLPNYPVRRAGAVVVLVVVSVAIAAVAQLAMAAIDVVADLGGRPAVASEIDAAGASAAPTPRVHVAAPGDTLWSIASEHRGDVALDRYVDALITLNGGTGIVAGQAVRLP